MHRHIILAKLAQRQERKNVKTGLFFSLAFALILPKFEPTSPPDDFNIILVVFIVVHQRQQKVYILCHVA